MLPPEISNITSELGVARAIDFTRPARTNERDNLGGAETNAACQRHGFQGTDGQIIRGNWLCALFSRALNEAFLDLLISIPRLSIFLRSFPS